MPDHVPYIMYPTACGGTVIIELLISQRYDSTECHPMYAEAPVLSKQVHKPM
jgi:hypothetical protein